MRRIFAFILLVSHMNTSMLLPQVPMEDVYDEYGVQLDDITSIVELAMVKLGFDNYPDDEDDDSGQNFYVPHFEYAFEILSVDSDRKFLITINNNFFDNSQEKISNMAYDVLVPPPDNV